MAQVYAQKHAKSRLIFFEKKIILYFKPALGEGNNEGNRPRDGLYPKGRESWAGKD